jgi:hypothetical protein
MQNMKKSGLILLILLVSLVPTAIILQRAMPVKAWGLATHMFMVSEVMDHVSDEDWAEVIDYYAPEVLAGCTTPDQAWQDWDNHLYYPETGEYTAPQAAQRWFNFTRDNFTAENWEDGFFAYGVMTHYYSDPCIPVHTDSNWPGHGGYEKDINENLDELSLETPMEVLIDNVSQFVIDCAIYSHQYYDTITEYYDDEDDRAIATTPELKTLTEDCLSMAINGCLSLFYTLTHSLTAPEISITYDYVALFDYAHTNDYIDYSGASQLTSVNQTLARYHFKLQKQSEAFDLTSFSNVDLLVITCGLNMYNNDELTAISNWAKSGNKTIIITGRGDFSKLDGYTDVASPNQVLEAIDSHIRINDDNVYMEGTYNPWYNDLTEIPDSEETVGLTTAVNTLTLFSPTSLYFTADDPVLPIVYADASGYQTDQDTEVQPVVVYDDTMDGVNGDQIPLIAAEEIDTLRVVVAGTTFFSNFDYGKSQFDNVQFFENILAWAVGDREINSIPDVDEIGPRISEISWTPTSPEPGADVNVSATVTDPGGVQSVSLKYEDGGETIIVSMTLHSDDIFIGEISDISVDSLEFRIVATDNDGNEAVRGEFTLNYGDETTTTTATTAIDTIPVESPIPIIAIAGAIATIGVVLVLVIFIKRR